jgi:predicted nucleic acid-binding Zn ribbon protein
VPGDGAFFYRIAASNFYLYIMGEYSIGDAMKKFLEGSRIKGGIQALQIEDVWENIMGKTVARYTQKLQIFGDKLIITTDVAPLKNELKYQKEKIKLRVNEALGKNVINEVEIK